MIHEISSASVKTQDDDDNDDDDFEDGDDDEFPLWNDSGNVICILILSNSKSPLDLKPSFSNLLICLVS